MRPDVRVAVLFALIACHDAYEHPSAKIGRPDSEPGGGTTRSISATFSRADLKTLYDRLNSPDLQKRLAAYTCGDPPPKIEFTVSIFEAAEYQERHVFIQPRPDPSPSGRERCLMFGLGYEIDREVAAIDRGEPINYHYHDPMTGKELPPYKASPPRQPKCDCSKRDWNEEWVSWPESR